MRSVSTKGLFVTLDRCRDARVKLSQLSDGFVEDPAAAFPVGSRVEGRIVSVEHTKPPAAGAAAAAVDDGVRVELSLRSGDGPGQLRTIADIQEGELTTGKVCCSLLAISEQDMLCRKPGLSECSVMGWKLVDI